MEIAAEHVRRTFLPDIPSPKLTDLLLCCWPHKRNSPGVTEGAVGIALAYTGVPTLNVLWGLCEHSKYSGGVLFAPLYVLWCE